MAESAKWYVVHTYSGYENAVKTSIEKFVTGRGMEDMILRIEVPMETVTEGPGGVMTITQVPGRKDQLLATSEFFSPNYGGDTAGNDN